MEERELQLKNFFILFESQTEENLDICYELNKWLKVTDNEWNTFFENTKLPVKLKFSLKNYFCYSEMKSYDSNYYEVKFLDKEIVNKWRFFFETEELFECRDELLWELKGYHLVFSVKSYK